MALAILRFLPNLLLYRPKTLIRSHFQNLRKTLTPKSRTLASKTHPPSSSRTLILTRDDGIGSSVDRIEGGPETIAAIVTSLGGGPAAVGIVRVSGPSAVEVARKVFRPARWGERKEETWWPRSHFVEYGVVLDRDGNLVDEMQRNTCEIYKYTLCGTTKAEKEEEAEEEEEEEAVEEDEAEEEEEEDDRRKKMRKRSVKKERQRSDRRTQFLNLSREKYSLRSFD